MNREYNNLLLNLADHQKWDQYNKKIAQEYV